MQPLGRFQRSALPGTSLPLPSYGVHILSLSHGKRRSHELRASDADASAKAIAMKSQELRRARADTLAKLELLRKENALLTSVLTDGEQRAT